jgi:translocation and assembly module TamB
VTLATTIFRHVLGVLAALAAFVVVVVIALTSTEVGRDTLRGEVERQFAQRYEGRIEIDRLSGNLLRHVFASDVRLYDSRDRLVASIDSVVYRPFWREVFDRTLSSGRLVLYRPDVLVTFDEEGPNLTTLFQRRSPRGPSDPWAFETADLRVVDGRLRTRNAGYGSEAIDRGLVFDYTESLVTDIHGRLRLDARDRAVRFHVRSLAADVVSPAIGRADITGNLAIEDDQISLEDLSLTSGETSIAASLKYGFHSVATPVVALEIEGAAIDNDRLRALVPVYPFADQANVSMRARGPLDALVVEELEISRGQSRLMLTGSVQGLPSHAGFQVSVDEGRLLYTDLIALEPRLAESRLRDLGDIHIDGSADGLARFASDSTKSILADANIRFRSRLGGLEGPIHVQYDSEGARLETTMDLRNVVPDPFIPGSDGTSLNGRLSAQLTGTSLDDVLGSVHLALGRSQLVGRTIDSLSADVALVSEGLRGRTAMFADGGAAFASGTVQYGSSDRAYEADLTLRMFDVGPWLAHADASTSINADVSVAGSGGRANAYSFRLSASFDSSAVFHTDERIDVPPHVMHAAFVPAGDPFEARIWGDVFDLDVASDLPAGRLISSLVAWSPRLSEAMTVEGGKRRTDTLPDVDLHRNVPVVHAEPFVVTATGRLHRPEWAATLLPGLSGLQTDLSFEAGVTATIDSLIATSVVQADSLKYSGIEAEAIRVSGNVRIAAAGAWPHGVSVDGTFGARNVSTSAEQFRDPRLSLALDDGSGAIVASTSGSDADERLRLAARLRLGTAYNSVLVDTLSIEARDARWSLASTQTLLQYSDAVVVPRLELSSRAAHTSALQRVRLQGVFSALPGDTLYAHLQGVSLRELSDMAGLQDPLEGVIDGQVAFTGLWVQPEITGDIDVGRLVFDGHPLGRLAVTSRYVPGEPDIALDLRLTPLAEHEEAGPGTGLPSDATPTDLRLNGSFRLPVRSLDRETSEPGMLDLALVARSADAFFFENIFRNKISDVTGHLDGRGRITGDFRRPVFDAQFTLRDGSVRVPAFNLAYQVVGNATVDRDGIRLHGVEVRDATGGVGRDRWRAFCSTSTATSPSISVARLQNSSVHERPGRAGSRLSMAMSGHRVP